MESKKSPERPGVEDRRNGPENRREPVDQRRYITDAQHAEHPFTGAATSQWRFIMTRDINSSSRSAIAPTSARKAPDAPPSEVVSMVASLPQIEAKETLVVQTMDRTDELTRELNDLNEKLSGELSHYTRDAVEGMNKRALEIEQQLETLENPPSAIGDAPGL